MWQAAKATHPPAQGRKIKRAAAHTPLRLRLHTPPLPYERNVILFCTLWLVRYVALNYDVHVRRLNKNISRHNPATFTYKTAAPTRAAYTRACDTRTGTNQFSQISLPLF